MVQREQSHAKQVAFFGIRKFGQTHGQ